MKRNQFGINLDEGIPLLTSLDFEQLHISCFRKTLGELLSWVKESDKPIILGGQIGSGKSTLINKAIQEAHCKPDFVLHFDQETLNLDVGDFLGITLAGFIKASLTYGSDLSFCKLPRELGGYPENDWDELLTGLQPQEFSMDIFANRIALRRKIAENSPYVRAVIYEMGKRLKTILGRPIFIFVSGLDKFNTASAAFFAMEEVISVLSMYKTLYEVNAVHLFSKRSPLVSLADRLFIPRVKQDDVIAILSKRMGVYAKGIQSELELLAQWSGGNPRQAIRLLTNFQTARNNKRNIAESLAVAIRQTTSDIFSYSSKPSNELIKTIQRSGKLETSLVSLPGDKDTARLALYGNWILISRGEDGLSWPAIVNPLVKATFLEPLTVEEPEFHLLNHYAKEFGISSHGLGLHRVDEATDEEKSGDQLLWDYFATGVEHPLHTNLSETLDLLSAALLSKDRVDRAIIAYKDIEVAAVARAYLFAKANSYEYQRCKHFNIEGGIGKEPLEQLEEFLSEDTDIVSLEFRGDWNNSQLEILDKKRDRFIDRQMIWWIPFNDLKKYLPNWIQLRQLFEILVLEDELLESISEEEVKDDLLFFEDLVEDTQSAEANVVGNLKIVLKYLQKVKTGEIHG